MPKRCAPSACKHMVSGSLSLPSRGAFHLSLTVLYSIGHQVVFSLRRWASLIPTEFLVLDGTLDTHCFVSVSTTGLSPYLTGLSRTVRLLLLLLFVSPNPVHISIYGLGSYPFARHYLGNRCFTFSSSGYLDVSVPRVPLVTLFIHVTILYISIKCVPAFGYLRINVHLQLPVAFRSLSRPSSAPDAKAFTIRSY